MRVSELITKLTDCNPDAEVLVLHGAGEYSEDTVCNAGDVLTGRALPDGIDWSFDKNGLPVVVIVDKVDLTDTNIKEQLT